MVIIVLIFDENWITKQENSILKLRYSLHLWKKLNLSDWNFFVIVFGIWINFYIGEMKKVLKFFIKHWIKI